MGCCMSSKAKTDLNPDDPVAKSRRLYPPPNPEPIRSQAAVAPPPPAEEETVKEVLSETPIFSKPTQIPSGQQPACQDQIFTRREEKEAATEKTPEISQVSEMYSAGDSYSTAATATTATTVTEVRDDEVTSKKRVVNRSPAKVPRKRPYNGERDGVSKPPVRRVPPPAKRELTGQGRSTPQRSNVGSSRVGRDLGERSGRRSRSPAMRTAAGGGVKGRGEGSPAKVVSGKSGGKASEVGVRSDEKKEEKSENGSVSMQQQQQQQENESLDNPLVSLECFIFL